jgi:hypothetical protein
MRKVKVIDTNLVVWKSSIVCQQLHIPKSQNKTVSCHGFQEIYMKTLKEGHYCHTAQGLHPLKGCAVRGIARKGEKVTTFVRTLKNPNVFCDLFLHRFTGDLHQTSWV